MAYTSPTTINASKGLTEIFNYVNSVTNQWVSNLLIIGIYIIVLIGFYKVNDDFKGALAVAGYSTFVIALLFWIGGFVSGFALTVAVVIAMVGTLVLLLDK